MPRARSAAARERPQGPILAPITVASDRLHILSVEHRLYVGLARDGSYLHVIAPRRADVQDADGIVVHAIGELACNCAGGIFHGSCYRLRQAEAYEQGDAVEEAWFGVPIAPETELERAAARG
jgi:hypothetical protein